MVPVIKWPVSRIKITIVKSVNKDLLTHNVWFDQHHSIKSSPPSISCYLPLYMPSFSSSSPSCPWLTTSFPSDNASNLVLLLPIGWCRGLHGRKLSFCPRCLRMWCWEAVIPASVIHSLLHSFSLEQMGAMNSSRVLRLARVGSHLGAKINARHNVSLKTQTGFYCLLGHHTEPSQHPQHAI